MMHSLLRIFNARAAQLRQTVTAACIPQSGRWRELEQAVRRMDAENCRSRAVVLAYGQAVVAQRAAARSNEQKRELDRRIHHSYYGSGGIAYHGGLLRDYVQQLLPRDDDLQHMWMSAYNSAILPMRQELARLEEACRRLQTPPEDPVADAALLQQLHYQDCGAQLTQLARLCRQHPHRADLRTAMQLHEQLRRATDHNTRLAHAARAPKTEAPYSLQNLPLLAALRLALGDEAVGNLHSPGGWTAGDYRDALGAFAAQLTETLLTPYAPPHGG